MPICFCVAVYCAQLGCQPVSGVLSDFANSCTAHCLCQGCFVRAHSALVVVVTCFLSFEHSSPSLCPALYLVHAH